ncbi:hypothetical protein Tco_1460729, partial [Tanacetum coccineum]
MKAGLATLGLVVEDHPSLSSSDLINSSPLHLEGSKNQRKPNVCYTIYLSLIMKHLIQDNYKNDKLLSLKPYHITAVTFKTTWNDGIALTSHMCKKVADLSPEPIQSLIPPSEEVNADDTADKSLSETSVQPVTQSKAPTAKRPRKKKIPSSTQPEPAKDFVVTADATKGLDASESAEVQGNQPETADATKVLDQNIIEEEDAGVHSLEEPTFEQLMDEVDKQKIDQTNDANITFMGSGPINMELDGTCS